MCVGGWSHEINNKRKFDRIEPRASAVYMEDFFFCENKERKIRERAQQKKKYKIKRRQTSKTQNNTTKIKVILLKASKKWRRVL